MTSILAGSMVFFSCVVAPLIFIKLDGDTAGYFVRSIFPWYYLVIASLAAISSVSLFYGYFLESILIKALIISYKGTPSNPLQIAIGICAILSKYRKAVNQHIDLTFLQS